MRETKNGKPVGNAMTVQTFGTLRMEKLRSLYIDIPNWEEGVKPDDFLVAIGKLKSNSVYHIAEVRPVPQKNKRITRYYLKVLKADLTIALQKESNQKIVPIHWYSRSKKTKEKQNGI